LYAFTSQRITLYTNLKRKKEQIEESGASYSRILRVVLNGIERRITRVANKRQRRRDRGGQGPIWLRGDGLKASNEKQLGRHALRFSRFAVFAAEIERVRVTGGIERS